MKKPLPLPSQDRIKESYVYCPDTGIFTRAKDNFKWKAGEVAGTLSGGYISISVGGVQYRAHRLAWMYMTGTEPDYAIDHINQVKTDNRWANLRQATQSHNMMNGKVRRNTASGVKGVYPVRNGYASKIMRDGKSIFLGQFKTVEEASAAYNAAGKALHGCFFSPSVSSAEPSYKWHSNGLASAQSCGHDPKE